MCSVSSALMQQRGFLSDSEPQTSITLAGAMTSASSKPVTLTAHAEKQQIHLTAHGYLHSENASFELPRIKGYIYERITETVVTSFMLRPGTRYFENMINSRFVIDNLVVTITFKRSIEDRDNLLNFIQKTFASARTNTLCNDIEAAVNNRDRYGYCDSMMAEYSQWNPLEKPTYESDWSCPSSVILSEHDDESL